MGKIHLGCGNHHFDGYINVDSDATEQVDVVADVRSLPFKDNSVEAVEAYHVLEHIPRQQVEATLREWLRVLIPGRMLILELPDFERNCKDLLQAIRKQDWETADMNMMFIYGGDTPAPEDAHRWGYNAIMLNMILTQAGFVWVEQTEPRNPHKHQAACFRLEATKDDG